MSRDLVIAPTPTSAKQCAPPRSAPVSSQSSTANTRAHSSVNDSANSFARFPNVIAFRTRTSTVPDRAPLLHASPTDRHLHCRESRRRRLNPSRTLARRRLLAAGVTTLSVPPKKQIFRKQGAPDRSRNFVG